MPDNGRKSLPTIGFLTVVEHQETGLTGGYLVLNTLGRPVEFHCTAPLKTNRAQEILYGPTLRPFLYGEQIGQTLLEKSNSQPLFVCTDVSHALAMRATTTTPVVLVLADANNVQDDPRDAQRIIRIDGQHEMSTRLCPFEVGEHHLAVTPRFVDDQQRVTELWRPYANDFDLMEPFQRIREAIAEAQGAR
jgi:hypothetical protein